MARKKCITKDTLYKLNGNRDETGILVMYHPDCSEIMDEIVLREMMEAGLLKNDTDDLEEQRQYLIDNISEEELAEFAEDEPDDSVDVEYMIFGPDDCESFSDYFANITKKYARYSSIALKASESNPYLDHSFIIPSLLKEEVVRSTTSNRRGNNLDNTYAIHNMLSDLNKLLDIDIGFAGKLHEKMHDDVLLSPGMLEKHNRIDGEDASLYPLKDAFEKKDIPAPLSDSVHILSAVSFYHLTDNLETDNGQIKRLAAGITGQLYTLLQLKEIN